MSRRAPLSCAGVASVLGILVGVNMLADTRLPDARLDVTQGHIYTLSDSTKTILRGLKEPVTLRLFWSPALGAQIPSYGAYHDRVLEMLRAFSAVSGGKVIVRQYDPEPFSDTEDQARAYGLTGVPVQEGGNEQVYFGIAGTNLLDDERDIAFLKSERGRFLEYDLAKLVYGLSNPVRPVVGVMSSLPIDGDPRLMMMARGQGRAGQPWVSMLQLRQTFDVRDIPADATAIDPKVQVLVVAQAQHLSEATQYAIDQFVMRGGRLMLMVDPVSEAEGQTPGPDGQPPQDRASDLHRLLDAWGIAYDPTKVVGDLDNDWRVRATGTDRVQAVDYVPWFNIRDGLAKNDPATGDLHQVTVASAGALAKKPGAPIDFTPLLTTSARSALIPAAKVVDPDPAAILAGFRPDGKPRVVAARVRGVLHSAFSGPPREAPPKDAKAAKPPALPPYKAQTDGPANLVVVADTDMLADRYWVRVGDFMGQAEATPFSDNGAFFANVVGTLAGGDALIGLRSRGDTTRPFTLVDRMQAEAEARFRATEQALQSHLQAVEKKLVALRGGTQEGGTAQVTITPAQRQEIEAARQDIEATRRKLREVQFDLRRDISRLKDALLAFDIGAVPALLVLGALVLGLVRRRRRRRRPTASGAFAQGAAHWGARA